MYEMSKPIFKEKYEKYFEMSSTEIFIQHAECLSTSVHQLQSLKQHQMVSHLLVPHSDPEISLTVRWTPRPTNPLTPVLLARHFLYLLLKGLRRIMMICFFTSLSILLTSYQDNRRVTMKGSVQ